MNEMLSIKKCTMVHGSVVMCAVTMGLVDQGLSDIVERGVFAKQGDGDAM